MMTRTQLVNELDELAGSAYGDISRVARIAAQEIRSLTADREDDAALQRAIGVLRYHLTHNGGVNVSSLSEEEVRALLKAVT